MNKFLITASIIFSSASQAEITKEIGTVDCPTNTYYSGGICLMDVADGTYGYTKDIAPIQLDPELTQRQKKIVVGLAAMKYASTNNGDVGVEPIEVIIPEPVEEPIKVSPIKEDTNLDFSWKNKFKILDPRDQANWEKLYDAAETNEAKALVQEMLEYMERWAGDEDYQGRPFDEIFADVKALVNELPTSKQVATLLLLNNLNMAHGKYDSFLHQLMKGYGYGNEQQLAKLESFTEHKSNGTLKSSWIDNNHKTIKQNADDRRARRDRGLSAEQRAKIREHFEKSN